MMHLLTWLFLESGSSAWSVVTMVVHETPKQVTTVKGQTDVTFEKRAAVYKIDGHNKSAGHIIQYLEKKKASGGPAKVIVNAESMEILSIAP